jgi:hypothetical protein
MSNLNKEVIMNDNKIKASAAPAENLQEALVLRPEWEIKPKGLEAEHSFTVQFSELTQLLTLTVNGKLYKRVKIKEDTDGKVKFYDALGQVQSKFDLWGLYVKN